MNYLNLNKLGSTSQDKRQHLNVVALKTQPNYYFFYLFIASLSLANVSYTQYCVQETAAYLQSYRELRTLTECLAIKLQIAKQRSCRRLEHKKNALRIKRQIKRCINNSADHAPQSPLWSLHAAQDARKQCSACNHATATQSKPRCGKMC